ncbi:MAG: cupin domain-containing protein [Patescibacteria group bacterium]|jgi:mannose-6-phosphate isomerase-like protein (cupin superfamily)
MANIVNKSFTESNENVTPEKTRVETATLIDHEFQRVTAEPGWQWSKHSKPVVGGKSCQKHHLLYIISGRIASRMSDGDEVEFGPGEIGIIPPGHDGWTVGDEPAVWLEIPH